MALKSLLRSPRLRWIGVVFVVAAAWRAAAVWRISQAFFFEFAIGDAAAYDAWAREIAAGDWLGNEAFYQAPLYPYWLAGTYVVLGASRLCVVVVQGLLGSIATALLCDAGWRMFSPRVGIVAGLLLAVYAPAIFFDLLIQKSSLDVFLVCSALWFLSRWMERPHAGTALGLGLCLGLLVLNRENALVLAAVLGAWLLPRGRTISTGRGWTSALGFATGLVVILAPVAARNWYVGGEWLITTAQSGTNFYIGNHAGATGTYVPLATGHGEARYEREDAQRIAEAATGRNLTPAEVSQFWWSQSWRFIRTEPADWARLLLKKCALFWNHVEMVDTEDLSTYADFAWPLRVPGGWLNFGVVTVAAMAGVWAGWSRLRQVRLLCLLVGVYWLSVAAFYVVARYRLPVAPMLMLLAGIGLTDGWRAFRSAGTWNRTLVVALCGGAAILCALPLVDRERQQTATRLNFGAELLDRGRDEEAADEFRTVLAINPNFVEAHYNLGRAYVALRRLGDAAICFSRALDMDPRFEEAALNLGNVSLELGETAGAILAYQHALKLAPDDSRVWYGLGTAHALRREWDRAIECLEEAVRLAPDNSAAQENLLRARELKAGDAAAAPSQPP